MAKSIEFTASGSCSALGNFAPGTIVRNIPDALADHLVKEAMCAKYLPVATTAAAQSLADPATSVPPSARKRKASAEATPETLKDH